MHFLVTNKFGNYPEGTLNTVILLWNNWNDYNYFTAFGVSYINPNGDLINIGGVRIGFYGQKPKDEKLLTIGDKFDSLSNNFFSLGTEDSYYENLNKLGEDIRDGVLVGLNDIAKNKNIFEKAIKEDVTITSLLRNISLSTVGNQFRRMANGGERLTNYSFKYYFPKTDVQTKPECIDFNVLADTSPPTNIQVIIGRNGVGKSHLLNCMIETILNTTNQAKNGKFEFDYNPLATSTFSNLVCVTFSAFDEFEFQNYKSSESLKYNYIGLKSIENVESNNSSNQNKFLTSLGNISASSRIPRWKSIIKHLETDPIFKDENIIDLIEVNKKIDRISIINKFNKLSSGHKIVLITITSLVELLQEKSLVFFDEPETHLHPPLLSSLIRAISELLINRNAVCIMTTHSPVVLQEIPKSCIWKLRKKGSISEFERLELESFGENVGVLTNEIFGLEVMKSGFYNILKDLSNEYESYESALENINKQLGIEGKSILRSLFYEKKKGNEEN